MKEMIKKLLRENLYDIGDQYKNLVKLNDLYINKNNMDDAFNKSIKIKNNVSKTKRPLEVYKMLDGSLFLIDGHHRIADIIKNFNNENEILNLEFNANIVITPTNTYSDALETNLYNGYIPFNLWIREYK
jgi:hypothetical protein